MVLRRRHIPDAQNVFVYGNIEILVISQQNIFSKPRCVWVNAEYQTYSCSYILVNVTVRPELHKYFPHRTMSLRLDLIRDWLSWGADVSTY